jgi:hypothetical protein|tara:strand:- start:558 stop:824 length:267 start_codon:yes stop_codon:yes gene_type:complete
MNNAEILNFLSKYDHSYGIMGNVYHAEKAFLVRSVINWCVEEKRKGNIEEEEFARCAYMVDRFIRGEVDLFWKDGKILVQEKGRFDEL